jgi:hypothetical protein
VLRVVAILIGVVGAVILRLSKLGAGSSLAGDAMIGGLILTWAFLQFGIRKLDNLSGSLRDRRFRNNRLFAAYGNGSSRGAD